MLYFIVFYALCCAVNAGVYLLLLRHVSADDRVSVAVMLVMVFLGPVTTARVGFTYLMCVYKRYLFLRSLERVITSLKRELDKHSTE